MPFQGNAHLIRAFIAAEQKFHAQLRRFQVLMDLLDVPSNDYTVMFANLQKLCRFQYRFVDTLANGSKDGSLQRNAPFKGQSSCLELPQSIDGFISESTLPANELIESTVRAKNEFKSNKECHTISIMPEEIDDFTSIFTVPDAEESEINNCEGSIQHITTDFIATWYQFLTTLPEAIEMAKKYKANKIIDRILLPHTYSQPPSIALLSLLDAPSQYFSKYPLRFSCLHGDSIALDKFIHQLGQLQGKVIEAHELYRRKIITRELVSKISHLNVQLPLN